MIGCARSGAVLVALATIAGGCRGGAPRADGGADPSPRGRAVADPGPASGAASASGSASRSASASASVAASSGVGAASPAPSTAGKHGSITILQGPHAGPSVGARFDDEISSGFTCTLAPVLASSACVVKECMRSGDAKTQLAGAGRITVGATGKPAKPPVVMDRGKGAAGTYLPRPFPRAVSGGETVTASAAGAKDGVPAFSATVTAPTRVTGLIRPTVPKTGPLTITTNADLPLEWPAGTGGELAVEIAAGGTTIQCRYDAGAGSATIPRAALAKLPPGGSGTFLADVRARTSVDAGPWKVELVVSDSVVSAATKLQ